MARKNSKEKQLKQFDGRQDELNPIYIFNLTHTQLLVDALNGTFDIKYLAGRQLANRGLDKEGKWVGFDRAKEVHGIQ